MVSLSWLPWVMTSPTATETTQADDDTPEPSRAVAVRLVLPALTAVIFPEASTVATAGLVEAQAIVLSVALAGITVAVSNVVFPTTRVRLVESRVMAVTRTDAGGVVEAGEEPPPPQAASSSDRPVRTVVAAANVDRREVRKNCMDLRCGGGCDPVKPVAAERLRYINL